MKYEPIPKIHDASAVLEQFERNKVMADYAPILVDDPMRPRIRESRMATRKEK